MAYSPQHFRQGGHRSARSALRSDFPFVLLSLVVLVICLYFASCLKVDKAPDEYVRYPLAYYIYDHGELPVGDEPEIVSRIWGFSYAFVPYLPCILAAAFMRLFSLFSSNPSSFIFAARIPSALSGALCTYATCKAGQLIWRDRRVGLLCGTLVGLLPQYVFISSYLNEDAMAVCGVALCIWSWARAWRTSNLTPSICVHLGAGIAVVALTYYNAYGVILASIVYFFALCSASSLGRRTTWRYAGLVAATALVLAGWFFVRNAIIHHGDFLGMRSMYALGEERALRDYRPTQRPNPFNLGLSFTETFITYRLGNWFDLTAASFFCCVGYLEFRLRRAAYYTYIALFLVGIATCAGIHRKETRIPWFLCVSLLITLVTPVLLSMYYSYYNDWQAQGRYIMSAAVPLAVLISGGYHKLSMLLSPRTVCNTTGQDVAPISALASASPILYIVIALVAFLFLYCATHYIALCLGPPFSMDTPVYFP